MSTDQIDEAGADMDPDSERALYAKLVYTLRESRKAMLRSYAVEGEVALLEKITSGQLVEHPAYDHYLGARILEQMRLHLRAEMQARFGGGGGSGSGADEAPASVHLLLKEKIDACYGHRLAEPARLAQDALLLLFDNDLVIEVRYFSAHEYAFHWAWGEAEMRIDTAPVHAGWTSHFHADDAGILPDPVTVVGTNPWNNLARLVDVLLLNPLLEPASQADAGK